MGEPKPDAPRAMGRVMTTPLGVILERREARSAWADHVWRVVAVLPGAPAAANWTVVDAGAGYARYHAATLPLELHAKETEAYVVNLESRQPSIFVVLSPNQAVDAPHDMIPTRVTAAPYDAEAYLESGDEIVERAPAPRPIVELVEDFVAAHHVDAPFIKRKRGRAPGGDEVFARPPGWSPADG